MTTGLWLVRHGPTHARGMVGWTDLPADLSDGRKVAAVSAALPEDALVVSSDLVRASATADAIGGERLRLPHARDLREIHFGAWEGRNFDDIAAADAELSRLYWEEPGPHAPPGGECWDAFQARVGTRLAALVEAHPDRELVCVAHFGVILASLALAGGFTPQQVMGFQIDPLSVTRVEFLSPSRRWRILGVNHGY